MSRGLPQETYVTLVTFVVVVVVVTAAQFKGAFEQAVGATTLLKVPTRLLWNGKGLSRTLSHVPLCILYRSARSQFLPQSLSQALITGQAVGFPPSARWRKSLR